MKRRVIAVAVGTLFAVVLATLLVPLRTGYRWPPESAEAIAESDAATAKILAEADAFSRPFLEEELAFERDMMLGKPIYIDPEWPPRYDWVWRVPDMARCLEIMNPSDHAIWRRDISLRIVIAEQGIVLLVGGVLLFWMVRRDRRRRAATA